MTGPPIYRESIFNYYVSIPIIIILFIMIITIIATGGPIGLVIPFVILAFLFVNIFKLKIRVWDNELQLILGIGLLKKSIRISDLELTTFKEKSIPWYLKGTLFKYDYQGNMVFCPRSGKALALEYKIGKNCIFIVSNKNRKLFEILRETI